MLRGQHRLDTILLGQRGHGAGHGIHLVIVSAQRKTPHLVREVTHPGRLTAQAHQPVRYGGGQRTRPLWLWAARPDTAEITPLEHVPSVVVAHYLPSTARLLLNAHRHAGAVYLRLSPNANLHLGGAFTESLHILYLVRPVLNSP